MTVAFVPRHPQPDHSHESRSRTLQRWSRSCRHRKGVISTCKHVNHSSRGRSDLAYVFHAPDISITTLRLSVTLASVRYCLSGVSKTFHLKRLQIIHVQYRLVFEELFGDFPVPTFTMIGWSAHQARSLGVYPNDHFGHRLDFGGSPMASRWPLCCMHRAEH